MSSVSRAVHLASGSATPSMKRPFGFLLPRRESAHWNRQSSLLGTFVVEQAEAQEHDRLLRRHPTVIEGGWADIACIAPGIIEDEPEAKAGEKILEVFLIADDAVKVIGASTIAAHDELPMKKAVRRFRQLLGREVWVLVCLPRGPTRKIGHLVPSLRRTSRLGPETYRFGFSVVPLRTSNPGMDLRPSARIS